MKKSIVKQSKSCYFCGREMGLERHHICFGSANRKLSEKDGLTVYLCHKHHRMIHDMGNEGRQMDLMLKQAAEYAWLREYGGTIEDFIHRYGKNYLYDDLEKDDG